MFVQRIREFDHFFCDFCRQYMYDELVGDPLRGVPSRTQVDHLPETWECPVCGASSALLRCCTLVDDVTPVEAQVARAAKVQLPGNGKLVEKGLSDRPRVSQA